MKSRRKRPKTRLAMAVMLLVAVVCGLFLFEFYVAHTDPDYRDFWWKYPRKPLPISWQPVVTTTTTDPISSAYPNLDYQGPSPWEMRGRGDESTPFHIRSNHFGFYTEYPIDQFPEKQEKEFRILLTGGSGAQGHGASSNEKMMYSLLQTKLQQSLADTGYTIRVINLALQGGQARTNSAVLRAFGHKLKPDMILAYNGANDIVELANQDLRYVCLDYYNNMLDSTYIEPHWVSVLGEHFPALFYRYGLAHYIKRTFYEGEYWREADKECLQDLGVDAAHARLKAAIYHDASIPMFADHFEAIKRDFCGIPIMLAWQAVQDGERTVYDRWLTDFDPETNPVAIVENLDTQALTVRFYNPEKRAVHFMVVPGGAPKPTWDQVIHAGEPFTQAEDTAVIPHGLLNEYAVTLSAHSQIGFNINRKFRGSGTIYYLALPPASTPPTAESIINDGKKLSRDAVAYGFKAGANPTLYFVVQNGTITSPVFKASEDTDVQNVPLPVAYYAMEAAPGDPSREVYQAYSEPELNKLRREHGVYQKFYEQSKATLDGYMNRYWYFLDVDQIANNVDPATVPGMKFNSIAVHLDDAGQEVVAGVIHDNLEPVIRKLIHDDARPSCPAGKAQAISDEK